MRTIAANDVVLNTYTTLGAAASAGASSITVGSVSALSSPAFASTALSAGDLLLVYQAQGATISAADTSSYGAITSLENAGRWEFVRVGSVDTATNTVTLDAREHPMGLARSYGAVGSPATTAQVVRVPQYARLQVSASGSVVAAPWNGTVGGIVALVSNSSLTVVGRIDASGAGFRGGAVDNMSSMPNSNVVTYRSADANAGGEKGESIAGVASMLADGRYGRGAPANGGGGGNSHNAGGGGGSNGGPIVMGVFGAGVMSSTVVGAAAWLLDPDYIANGNQLTLMPGGGRGGYSYSANNANPLTTGPGGSAWGGDLRREVGGRGGRSLGAALDRLFFGGGGGAGDANNNVGGAGGAGGGLVFLVARTIDGNGTVASNGAAGANAMLPGNDAAGGGGAGGTIVLSSVAPISAALDAQANGGAGGSQAIAATECEGPGGGGGGGVVHFPFVSSAVVSVAGGVAGTTTGLGSAAFPVNGATGGSRGSTATLIPCAMFIGICPIETANFVTVTSPADGATVNTRTPTITGTAIAGLVVTLDFGGGRTAMVTADAMGNWTYTIPAGMELADGAMVTVTASATSGGTTRRVSVTFTIDASTTVTVSAPVAGSSTMETRPAVVGTGEPGATVTLVFATGERATVTVDAMGNWRFTPTMPLPEGRNEVQIIAQDRAGNTAMATHVFIVVVGVDASADAVSVDVQDATVPTDVSSDVSSDVSGDAIADARDATVADVVVDGAMDSAADGSADGSADAQVPVGRLTGDGACDCRVVNAGQSGARAPLGALVACAATLVCATRRRRGAARKSH